MKVDLTEDEIIRLKVQLEFDNEKDEDVIKEAFADMNDEGLVNAAAEVVRMRRKAIDERNGIVAKLEKALKKQTAR